MLNILVFGVCLAGVANVQAAPSRPTYHQYHIGKVDNGLMLMVNSSLHNDDEITNKGFYIGMCIGAAVLLGIILGLIVCFMRQTSYGPKPGPPLYVNGNGVMNPYAMDPTVDFSNITVRGPLVQVPNSGPTTQLGKTPYVRASNGSSLHFSQNGQGPGAVTPQQYALVDGSGQVTLMTGQPDGQLTRTLTRDEVEQGVLLPGHPGHPQSLRTGDPEPQVISAQVHHDNPHQAPQPSLQGSYIPGSSTLRDPTPGTSGSDPSQSGSVPSDTIHDDPGNWGNAAHTSSSDLEQEELILEMPVHHHEEKGHKQQQVRFQEENEQDEPDQGYDPESAGKENVDQENDQDTVEQGNNQENEQRNGQDNEDPYIEWEQNELYQTREEIGQECVLM